MRSIRFLISVPVSLALHGAALAGAAALLPRAEMPPQLVVELSEAEGTAGARVGPRADELAAARPPAAPPAPVAAHGSAAAPAPLPERDRRSLSLPTPPLASPPPVPAAPPTDRRAVASDPAAAAALPEPLPVYSPRRAPQPAEPVAARAPERPVSNPASTEPARDRDDEPSVAASPPPTAMERASSGAEPYRALDTHGATLGGQPSRVAAEPGFAPTAGAATDRSAGTTAAVAGPTGHGAAATSAPAGRTAGGRVDGGDATAGGAIGGGAETALAAVPADGGAAYASYLTLIRRRIQESLQYPESARRREVTGTVGVVIVVEPTGVVSNVSVFATSGHPVLDRAALSTVRALPAVPFPDELTPRRLEFRLPVQFNLDGKLQ